MLSNLHQTEKPNNRRSFLQVAGSGLGMIGLWGLLSSEAQSDDSLLTAKLKPHFEPRAKRVIWLFMHGGPSHVDLLDPKPELQRLAGSPLPQSFGEVVTRRKVASNPLLGPVMPFRKHGQSGLELSDWLPNIASHADDLCVIRSMQGDSVNHPQSVYQMNTGSIVMGKPSVGSWVAYGLGSENADLPAFVVLPDPRGGLKGGPPAWGSGYLPASYQGVPMRSGDSPILNLSRPSSMSARDQRVALNLTQELNKLHLQ